MVAFECLATEADMRIKYGRAAIAGTSLGLITFGVASGADHGVDISHWLASSPREYVPYFATQILMWPIIFLTIASVINLFDRPKKPETSPASKADF
jgi:hypothetical protein